MHSALGVLKPKCSSASTLDRRVEDGEKHISPILKKLNLAVLCH